MELKTSVSCEPIRVCDTCGKKIQIAELSLHAYGGVYCVNCMKEIYKVPDDLTPLIEFSRETFVKLP